MFEEVHNEEDTVRRGARRPSTGLVNPSLHLELFTAETGKEIGGGLLVQLVPNDNLTQIDDVGVSGFEEGLDLAQSSHREPVGGVVHLELLQSDHLAGGNVLCACNPSVGALFDVVQSLEVVDVSTRPPFLDREAKQR